MNLNALRLTYFLSMIFFATFANAQNLEVLVKKGSIRVSKIDYMVNQKVTISNGQIVQVNPSSIALAKFEGKVVELASGKSYSYDVLKSKFPQEKSFAFSFFDLLFNSDTQPSGQTGITTRGGVEDFNVNALQISPSDSSIILSDSVRFVSAVGSKLVGWIYLYNEDNTLIDSLHDNSFKMKMISGTYSWKYQFNYQNNNYDATWFFYVPQKEKLEELKREIKSFKVSIEDYSKELQAILWNDFVSIRKIYIY